MDCYVFCIFARKKPSVSSLGSILTVFVTDASKVCEPNRVTPDLHHAFSERPISIGSRERSE